MNSRFFLTIAVLLGALTVPGTLSAGVNPPAKITEADARRIHQAWMDRQGLTGIRMAYKRSDIEKLLHQEALLRPSHPVDVKPHPEAAAVRPKAVPVKATPSRQDAPLQKITPAGRSPKFIEHIVIHGSAAQ